MNKEKIVRLIKSGTHDDILIAFCLLKDWIFEDLSELPEVDYKIGFYCHFQHNNVAGNEAYYKINDNLFGYIGPDSVAFRTKDSKMPHIEVIDL